LDIFVLFSSVNLYPPPTEGFDLFVGASHPQHTPKFSKVYFDGYRDHVYHSVGDKLTEENFGEFNGLSYERFWEDSFQGLLLFIFISIFFADISKN